jgi:phosphotransferase system enzyme I (PtsI)
VEAAAAQQVPLSVCGEMAAVPQQAALLVGLGFRELSMTPSAIPRVKAALRATSAERARETARACLSLRTEAEIAERLGRDLAPPLQAADLGRETA